MIFFREIPMPMIFYIPGPLRALTGGRDQVEVDTRAATVRDALAHPGTG